MTAYHLPLAGEDKKKKKNVGKQKMAFQSLGYCQ